MVRFERLRGVVQQLPLHLSTTLAWTLYRRAISATDSWSRSAANATFALNAGLCFVRVFFMVSAPPSAVGAGSNTTLAAGPKIGVHYFFTEEWRAVIRKNMLTGATVDRIPLTSFPDFPVKAPQFSVQQRIADVLSAYDELIENNQRRIQILETMARALYREWFVEFRFPGHEKIPRVASPLGDIPQGWETKPLGEVAHIFRGRSYRSVDLAGEGGLPFLNLKCIDRDGGFRRSGLKRYTGEYRDTHIAKKGDIVVAVTDMTQERRIVARAALVPTLKREFGVYSMDLVRVEPRPPMPGEFLYAFLRYSSFGDEVKQHANGVNVLHLAPKRITEFQLVVPPIDLIRQFTGVSAPTVGQMDTLESQIENLRCTRDLLLPRLLSGQVALTETAA